MCSLHTEPPNARLASAAPDPTAKLLAYLHTRLQSAIGPTITIGCDTMRLVLEALERRGEQPAANDIREIVEAAIDDRFNSHPFTRGSSLVRRQSLTADQPSDSFGGAYIGLERGRYHVEDERRPGAMAAKADDRPPCDTEMA